MFTSLALAAAVAHPGPFGPGFGWLFFLIPLFWIGVIALIIGLAGRRWRRAGFVGGPGGHGHWGHYGPPWAQSHGARNAESTLAERYAQGDIDEKEYRARLDVLRASAPQPPVPPQK